MANTALKGKVRLYRVRLDRGGYERPHGRYYGIGEPLWRAEDEDGEIAEFRAPDRAAAKAKVPGCTFYR